MKPWAALAALALITMMAWPARADAPSPAPQSSAANALSPSSPPPRPSPKRPVPDYRGRHESNHPAASAVLWVPRVILAPVYLATEYVIREPLSLAIAAAEKAELPRKVYDFFTWGPEHKAGLVPIGFFEFDFNPSVGVYVFWNDAIAKDNDWSLHTEAWPTDWYAVSLKESMRVDRERVLDFHVLGTHRPDRVFYGLGPESLQSSQSRFTQAVTEGGAALDWKYLRESHVKLMAGVRSVSLGPGTYGSSRASSKKRREEPFQSRTDTARGIRPNTTASSRRSTRDRPTTRASRSRRLAPARASRSRGSRGATSSDRRGGSATEPR